MSGKILFGTLMLLSTFFQPLRSENYRLLVGTYTRGTESEGIYALEVDNRGNLDAQKLIALSDNPSFLSFSPDKQFVYAVNETGKESFVTAFAFDANTSALSRLNQMPVKGDPCHLVCTPNHVITANYSSGSITVFGRKPSGRLTDVLQEIIHPRKQFGNRKVGPSNVHQIVLSPNGEFVVVTNLGTDRVFTYRYHADDMQKPLTYVGEIMLKKGSGPRHLTFSRNGKFIYLVQELSADITVLSVSKEGKLAVVQEKTLVADASKRNGAADIHLSPDGHYLYATNRGEANTITVFKVKKDGTLKTMKQYLTSGDAPRNFAISPDGKFLLIGNQKSNKITVFKRKNCGKLKRLRGNDISLPAPVCLLFY